MNTKDVIKSQYYASLEMLERAVESCPESMWADATHKNKFWHIAFHALFYTHLYLQPAQEDFVPWEKHRQDYQFMGPVPWPPHNTPEIGKPYSKEDVLEYLELCKLQVEEQITALNLEADSGFEWLPFKKLELQFYTIRHLQNHVGELCERLGETANIDVDWVGSKPDQ